MSHVVANETEIPDAQLHTLKTAAEQMGLVWVEGKTTYQWYGKWVNDYDKEDAAYKNGIKPEDYGKCAHVIQLPGCRYEIGVYLHPETKNYRLIYDFFGPGKQIQAVIGKNAEKLWTLQGEVHAHDYAKRKGLVARKRVLPNGNVEMVLTKR